MVRHQKVLVHIFAIAFYLSFAACSSKSSTPVEVTQAGDPYSTQSDDYDYSSNNNLFNSSDNSNLFSSSTSSTETSSTSSYPTVTEQQQACLNGTTTSGSTGSTQNYNPNIPPWQQYNNTSGLSSACMSSANNGTVQQDMLLDFGLENFGYMQLCYQLVMSKGPQMCASGQDAGMTLKMGGMALVRCFRQILAQQMAFVQWEPQQKQVYQQNDNSLLILLSLLQQSDQ